MNCNLPSQWTLYYNQSASQPANGGVCVKHFTHWHLDDLLFHKLIVVYITIWATKKKYALFANAANTHKHGLQRNRLKVAFISSCRNPGCLHNPHCLHQAIIRPTIVSMCLIHCIVFCVMHTRPMRLYITPQHNYRSNKEMNYIIIIIHLKCGHLRASRVHSM